MIDFFVGLTIGILLSEQIKHLLLHAKEKISDYISSKCEHDHKTEKKDKK